MPNEFYAALIGGVLSLLGSAFAIWLQQRSQIRERRKIVGRFVVEHGAYLADIAARLEEHFKKNNEIWFEYVEQIGTVFAVFNRNLEHLIFIDDEKIRKDVREYFSQCYYLAQRARFWQQKMYDLGNRLKALPGQGQLEKSQIENELVSAHLDAKNCIVELKQKTLELNNIKLKLEI